MSPWVKEARASVIALGRRARSQGPWRRGQGSLLIKLTPDWARASRVGVATRAEIGLVGSTTRPSMESHIRKRMFGWLGAATTVTRVALSITMIRSAFRISSVEALGYPD